MVLALLGGLSPNCMVNSDLQNKGGYNILETNIHKESTVHCFLKIRVPGSWKKLPQITSGIRSGAMCSIKGRILFLNRMGLLCKDKSICIFKTR